MVDAERLLRAYETARHDLLAERCTDGHWIGELSSSALATATAVSALALVARHRSGDSPSLPSSDELHRHITGGLRWLATQQNADGGFGDTDKSHSNIATTLLVRSAFELARGSSEQTELLAGADAYLTEQGGVPALRERYGRDRTFAVPILTNAALAGLVEWSEVSPLPFELACLPQSSLKFVNLPVVSYALPALIAIGLARFVHRPPRNPLWRLVRRASVATSLAKLERIQPLSGGFLEATPLTSFVVMSLAAIGRSDHPVVPSGVEFLINSVRSDGSWPIDTNLATWTTSLSMAALATGGEDLDELNCVPWLLACQHRQVHPFTAAEPGGWGWTDLSGAVPDADDTPAAMVALSRVGSRTRAAHGYEIDQAVTQGAGWLLDLQNRDGGWPTFCRGWGALPFDRSGADLTAHALRALTIWRKHLTGVPSATDVSSDTDVSGDTEASTNSEATGQSPVSIEHAARWATRIDTAVRRGLTYLRRQQLADGSWLPLWFGNQHRADEENPIYGTAKVLAAYRDLDRLQSPAAKRAVAWLSSQANPDGGFGGPGHIGANGLQPTLSSVEETALALEALLEAGDDPATGKVVDGALEWLVRAVEEQRHRESSPIGFYFAKLWYYERLYPLIYIVSALGTVVSRPRNGGFEPAENKDCNAETVVPVGVTTKGTSPTTFALLHKTRPPHPRT